VVPLNVSLAIVSEQVWLRFAKYDCGLHERALAFNSDAHRVVARGNGPGLGELNDPFLEFGFDTAGQKFICGDGPISQDKSVELI
jgi:hypothetical protein